MDTGKQYTDTSVTSDASWATTTVTIGFNLMGKVLIILIVVTITLTYTLNIQIYVAGIWPPCSDGTDINSLDVSRDNKLVCTAGDNGKMRCIFIHAYI